MVLPKIVVVLQQGRTGGAKVLGVGKLYSRGAHAVMGENAVGGVDQPGWVELLGEGVEVWRKRPAKNRFERVSAPLSSCRGLQAALKCPYRSDCVTRD